MWEKLEQPNVLYNSGIEEFTGFGKYEGSKNKPLEVIGYCTAAIW